MNYIDSRFKKEKVEKIIKENGISFKLENERCYDSYVELFGHKKSLKISIKKSHISIKRSSRSHCTVNTYKDFNKVLAFYVNEIVEEILNPVLS